MNAPQHLFQQLSHLKVSDVGVQTHHDIEQFYFLEAELLDTRKFEEWLALFSQDVRYWAPVRENRSVRDYAYEIAPPGGAALFDDDHASLTQRVRRMQSGRAWTEVPASRTRHLVTNLRAFQVPDRPQDYDVETSICVYRNFGEKNEDWVIGKRFDRITRTEGTGTFTVSRRTLVLDMATVLPTNLGLFY